jgi:hypothetical protein
MVGRPLTVAGPSPSEQPGFAPSRFARWVESLPAAAYAAAVGAVLALLVLAVSVLNPGERVGPVSPTTPPVGGSTLPSRTSSAGG